jgi:protein TonB
MRSRQGASVLVAIAIEACVIGMLIVIPLMAIEIVPMPSHVIGAFVTAPSPPPPPPPPPSPSREPERSTPTPVQSVVVEASPTPVPIDAPIGITPEAPTDNRFERGGASGAPGGSGVPDGVPGGTGDTLRPPPPPPPAPQVRRDPVHVGGVVRPPRKIKDVAPIYPEIAVRSRTEGIVIVEATIGVDGRVTNLHVLRGHPLLNDAAMTAVRQWEFTPTTLNGEAVPVIMSVTVRFQLR